MKLSVDSVKEKKEKNDIKATEEILNKYGFTMNNKNYGKGMGYRVKAMAHLIITDVEKCGSGKIIREKIIRAFMWEASGIRINDLELFKGVFGVEKMKIKLPLCLMELMKLSLAPTSYGNPFTVCLDSAERTEKR